MNRGDQAIAIMTKDDWAAVEQALMYPYGSAELICDGYKLRLMTVLDKPLKLAITWYVDGHFKGEFLKADSEIGKRFACPHVLHAYSSSEKKKIIKNFGKREAAKYFPRLDATHTYRSWSWSSFGALKRHLIANNQVISLAADDAPTSLTSEVSS